MMKRIALPLKKTLHFLTYSCVLSSLFFASNHLNAQVGINNTDPKASLDISASNPSSPTNTDGLLVPRVSDFPGTAPTVDQNGMLLYLTTTVGLNTPGFYYWNQTTSSWLKVTDSSVNSSDADFYEEGTTTAPDDITDDIFTQGRMAVGRTTISNNNAVIQAAKTGLSFMQITSEDNGVSGLNLERVGAGQEFTLFSTGIAGLDVLSFTRSNSAFNGWTNDFYLDENGEFTIAAVSSELNNKVGIGLSMVGFSEANKVTIRGYGNTSATSALKLKNSADTDLLNVKDSGFLTIGTSTTGYTLPASRGTNNQIMQTDASGNVSWVDPSSILESEWIDNGAYLSPADGATEAINLGGSTSVQGKLNSTSALTRNITLSTARNNGALSAIYNVVSSQGTGLEANRAIHNILSSGGNAFDYGVYNEIAGNGSGGQFGMYNAITATNNNSYGVSTLITGSSPGNNIGVNNSIEQNGIGEAYGTFNYLTGSGNGNKYGTLVRIPSTTGGTQYGLYSAVQKSGSFAGFFAGNLAIGTQEYNVATPNYYIMPASRGTNNQIMQTDASGNVSWVDIPNSSYWSRSGTELDVTTTGDDIHFTSDQTSITFAQSSGTPSSMIYMFDGGSSNVDRMVLSHSSAYPAWGLEYEDVTDSFIFKSATAEKVEIDLNGGFPLRVYGTARAEDFQSDTTIYPDYVFENYFKGYSEINSEYYFKTLSEIETFIKQKGYLPGVKSYEEIKEKGMVINLAETSITNLEKIEELFLYAIEMKKENEALKEKQKSVEERLLKIEQYLKNN